MTTSHHPITPVLPDYHTHTGLCKHAEGWPREYAEAAARIGLEEIAFTDHLPSEGDRYDRAHRMDENQFAIYREAVEEAQRTALIPTLFGVEADFYRDGAPFQRAFFERMPFDLVLGSVHTGPFFDITPEHHPQWSPSKIEDMWRTYFTKITHLADTRLYDIVAHLDLPKRSGLTPSEQAQRDMILPALDAIARADMAIEINTSGIHHPMREPYPSPQILTWARERHIPIVFGSDAHAPEAVGQHFAQALRWAREAGYTTYARYRERRRTLHPLPPFINATPPTRD